jgi:hypothetical protein
MTSPAWDIHVAIETALSADAQATAFFGNNAWLHSLKAPSGSVAPYGVLGPTGEGPFNTFAKPGVEGEIQIDLWTSSANGMRDSLLAYKHLHRILDGTALTLTNPSALLDGRIDLITSMLDQDDERLVHAIARYTYIARGS